jgi:hypothetical protein
VIWEPEFQFGFDGQFVPGVTSLLEAFGLVRRFAVIGKLDFDFEFEVEFGVGHAFGFRGTRSVELVVQQVDYCRLSQVSRGNFPDRHLSAAPVP